VRRNLRDPQWEMRDQKEPILLNRIGCRKMITAFIIDSVAYFCSGQEIMQDLTVWNSVSTVWNWIKHPVNYPQYV
jgi:hypothetical protein